ncbi:MAG TPA: ferritin-like domain-containing protein [Kofleriaceae bacterium]|nr:ferritin-like domain-containing protein [Kofleriaceae bacterium]
MMLDRLATWQARRSRIPFTMFDLPRNADVARRMDKLRHIYHRGQELAWDGREVLRELVAKHGGIRVEPALRESLGKVFSIILWGELAAWKISAELADELEPLEAKMAATAQAHDEARHFYTMYDYLVALGHPPARIDPWSQRVLDLTLGARTLVQKLLGMQLMLETIALTIFAEVRESGVEPVLADLLRYYEKDEARHVGLGTQFAPTLMRRQRGLEAADTMLFQLRLIFWSTASLKAMEGDLHALGIAAPRLIERGKRIQTRAFQELWNQLGGEPGTSRAVNHVLNGIDAAVFPGVGVELDLGQRMRRFVDGVRAPLGHRGADVEA